MTEIEQYRQDNHDNNQINNGFARLSVAICACSGRIPFYAERGKIGFLWFGRHEKRREYGYSHDRSCGAKDLLQK